MPLVSTKQKQLQARERIDRAAHELFWERGVEAVFATEIGNRAELGRISLFRYFGAEALRIPA
jgi:AcrR family transcriptional regulator